VIPDSPEERRGGRDGEFGSLAAEFRRRGPTSWATHRWHDLGASAYPAKAELFEGALPGLIREWVLRGHKPLVGTLEAQDSLITLGSCFALELRKYLTQVGFSAKNFWIPSGLNNTFAILDFVAWCITGQETGSGFRYDRTDEGEIREWTPEAERERYREGLEQAGAFVFTLGLAEVWEDKETGGVFWRGVPEEIFDADRHVFRLTTAEQNEANLVRIVELIRSANPAAPIVLTLSPVPLKATFRDVSCVSADCVSKATLRLSLDRVMSRGLEGVYYWPSFEIVRWLGAHYPWPAFGVDDGNARRVDSYLVSVIIDAFVEAFYTPAAVAELRAKDPGSLDRPAQPGNGAGPKAAEAPAATVLSRPGRLLGAARRFRSKAG
jgi:hypothetical protein